MRYILVLAGILTAVLWGMNQTEQRLGTTRLLPVHENVPTQLAGFSTGELVYPIQHHPGEPVGVSVTSRDNGEHFVRLSDPLPVTLGEVSGIARYVGMLRMGFQVSGEISAARATVEEVWEYDGKALWWTLEDGGVFYCLPVRDPGLETFSSALVWREPPSLSDVGVLYASLDSVPSR